LGVAGWQETMHGYDRPRGVRHHGPQDQQLAQGADAGNSPGRQAQGLPALRSTLHALRDRLTVEEVAQLGAQLPMLIRGFYYEGWDSTRKPLKLRDREEFLSIVDEEFRTRDTLNPELIARAVFRVLANRVAAGEIEDVKHVLPEEIRDLGP
jgi:uncharacterized protein (DUF2267 family)